MAVSIATGSFRPSCLCGLSSDRHTGMRSSGRKVLPAKAGRSASAVANCLYPAAIVRSIARTAALRFPGHQTGIGSVVSGRAKSRGKRNGLEISRPFIHAGFRRLFRGRMNIRSSCLRSFESQRGEKPMSYNALRPFLRNVFNQQHTTHPSNTGGTHEEERNRDYRHCCFRW